MIMRTYLKKSSIAIVTASLLFVLSCGKASLDLTVAHESNLMTEVQGPISAGNSVSMSDIISIIERDAPKTKSGDVVKYRIEPYIGENADSLMYIVNFDDSKGWKIYSSDKRIPAIIAEGDKGHFSIEEGSPAVVVWLDRISKDIASVKKSNDSELTLSSEEIESNQMFWSPIRRIPIDPPVPEPNYPPGHWEEVVYTRTLEYDRVDHMVAKWHQGYPYNTFCPLFVSIPDSRAYCGCVAIAGSQLLNFLHDRLSVPEKMYGSATISGDTNGFIRNFSDSSSFVWTWITNECQSSVYEAIEESILIAYVGDCVNMHYVDNITGQYSWALPRNIKTKLLEPYGINCSIGAYDSNTVKNSLLGGMPVIVWATDLLIPVDFDIHCFVIDGYREVYTEYEHHHHYVVDELPDRPYMVPRDYSTYTYSSHRFDSIRINWGWRSQWDEDDPVNDGWYSLASDWTVENGDDSYSYNQNVNMIYNFTI